MTLKDSLLAEFSHEMATTRRVLERVPEDKLSWKPHEKSWSMVNLATHIANLPVWSVMTIQQDALDLNPPGETGFTPPSAAKSSQELLAFFDKNVADAQKAIEATNDAELLKPWTLLNAGQSVFTMPKIAVLGSFVVKHIVHHRGQLTVYLRLNDAPVPSVYGPSADEEGGR